MTTRREIGASRQGLSPSPILVFAFLAASCSSGASQKQDEAAADALKLERERQERLDNVEATKHLQNVSSQQNPEKQ